MSLAIDLVSACRPPLVVAYAELLGIGRVLVPRDPGLLSALGMLAASPLHSFSQGLMLRVDSPELRREPLGQHPRVLAMLSALRVKADAAMEDMAPAFAIVGVLGVIGFVVWGIGALVGAW